MLDHVQAKKIVMPFTGSGKNISSFARTERVIYSWDTQETTKVLVDHLRMPWSSSALPEARGIQGYAREHFPFKDMDEGTARLLNYIALKGNNTDRAALVKTIFRCSAMGRLGLWSISLNSYRDVWDKFLRCRDSLQPYAGLAPTTVHVKGDYFSGPYQPVCDVLYVDPPKIIGQTDIYCTKGFMSLNAVMEQRTVEQPTWRLDGYLDRIRAVVNSTKWQSMIFFYSSGLVPTLEEILQILPKAPTEIKHFSHGNRLDYGIVVSQ